MIDIEILRNNPDAVKRGVAAKGFKVDVPSLLRLDKEWRKKITELEEKRHEQKTASELIASSSGVARKRQVAGLRRHAKKAQELEDEVRRLEIKRLSLWRRIPNLPLPTVPPGSDASANVTREKPQEIRKFDFVPLHYLEIGTRLGIIDVERAAMASGTRFGALVGDGARLALALVQHALEFLSPKEFIPLFPPVMIREEGMRAMGYLDHEAKEVYHTKDDDLLLVGTSEQSVGAMHAGVTFRADQLPQRFVAFSSCFRREAGSHGKDVRGILRVHQFEKAEMFSFCKPDQSEDEHAAFLGLQKKLMDDLELPYRVVEMCTGDLGFTAARKIDLETWFPARETFTETHSTSNVTDFQARRLGTKFRSPGGAAQLVHTVNGTAYAIQRTIAAILENHQEKDGNVRVPKVLRPLLGGRDRLSPAR